MSDNRQIDWTRLKGIYGRLKGLDRTLSTLSGGVRSAMARDHDTLAKELSDVLGEDTSSFICGPSTYYSNGEFCTVELVRSKLAQLIGYLEHVFQVGSSVVEIGSIFNSIQDTELKERCADLLSAPGNFDRVINQATQVLEDRIRRKSGGEVGRSGVELINDVLRGDLAKTVLKVSEDQGEQQGITDICRGIMSAFRNPTHHQITDKFSREDALKLCVFVDSMLKIIDAASVVRRS